MIYLWNKLFVLVWMKTPHSECQVKTFPVIWCSLQATTKSLEMLCAECTGTTSPGGNGGLDRSGPGEIGRLPVQNEQTISSTAGWWGRHAWRGSKIMCQCEVTRQLVKVRATAWQCFDNQVKPSVQPVVMYMRSAKTKGSNCVLEK